MIMGLLNFLDRAPEISTARLRTSDVRRMVEAEGVVRLEAPGITARGFADFMETLGEPMFTEGETPVVGLPNLNVVTNVGRKTAPRSVFHSDTTYVARPPSYSGLYPVEVPTKGGATIFVDQYDAYDQLAPSLAKTLADATMLHSASQVKLTQNDERAARHPVVRTHPGTGRKALFLTTPERCSNLVLSTGEDRSDLIKHLYDHSIAHASRKTHHWSKGDIVIWDNRCTLHAADHSNVSGNRTLFRALVRGEAPI